MHYFPNSIKEKKRFLENPQLTLGQQRIPYADPEIKYLETTLNYIQKIVQNLNTRNRICSKMREKSKTEVAPENQLIKNLSPVEIYS